MKRQTTPKRLNMRGLFAAVLLFALGQPCLAQQGKSFRQLLEDPEFERKLSDLSKEFEAEAKASKADRRAEAIAVVSNILSAAGVRGFRILQGDEIPVELRQSDAVWHAPGLTGSTTIAFSGAAISTPEDVASIVMAEDAKRCKGLFASGRYPTEPGASARLMTGCSSTAAKVEVHYTIASRRKGGFYVFSVVGLNGGDKAAQDAGVQIYTVATRILSR